MSAQLALDLDVDLEANQAEGSVRIAIDRLFVDNELRLWEDDHGWEGYSLEGGTYYYVNSWAGSSWPARIRVGEEAVRNAIKEHVEDPRAGGVGVFERGCLP